MGILIGITGNVASGKSLVLSYLSGQGYKVFNADNVVRDLYSTEEVQEEVLAIFPEMKLFDKNKIAEIIYNDKGARLKLERLIHPIVIKELMTFVQKEQEEQIIFAEIPLLFEKNLESHFNYIITVYCDKNIRKQRAAARGMKESIFNLIDDAQIKEEEKIKKADFALNSNSEIKELKFQIEEVIKKIKGDVE